MQTALPQDGLQGYKSKSQIARVATEAWALRNLYCPRCTSPRLNASPTNTPVIDFNCPSCAAAFQLKSQSHALSHRIVDSAYAQMVRAIREDGTPNLFAIHYDSSRWAVTNLILIPHFAFPLSAIEKRKPLGPNARRAGWVGCNILLDAIPLDVRIPVISEGMPVSPEQVRRHYSRIRPLERLSTEKRGWTLDVLNAARSLGKSTFELAEMYVYERRLAELHPQNRHVREKIRQQLQILRDIGILEFLDRGQYRIR